MRVERNLSILGNLRLVGVMADPVAQVRTPQLMSELFADRGINALCIPLHVPGSELGPALAALRSLRNFNGVVLTIPHKQNGSQYCDRISDRVRWSGSVNCIRLRPDGTLEGETFDGCGFVAGLRDQDIRIKGKRVLLAGAGGAAASIAAELAREGVATLHIQNRDVSRAKTLGELVSTHFPATSVSSGPVFADAFDLVVNATSVGLNPDDPSPIAATKLSSATVVAEALVSPVPTRLERAAKSVGAQYIGGIAMLQGQLDLIADFLSG